MIRRAASIVNARHVLCITHNPAVADSADSRINVSNGTVEVVQ
jgi:DNA repair ATPase RecN